MSTLIERIRTASTETILESIVQLQDDFIGTNEQKMVRAALIEVYAEREGEEMAIALMDKLGI